MLAISEYLNMQTIPLQSGIIYGPVRSRRLGWSLGLNISPVSYKLCSFNCVYCQYGRTTICTLDAADRLEDLPTLDDFAKALESALHEHKEIDNITFSGNGEPTLHPQFAELVDIAKKLKEEYFPEAKLGVLSNSSTVVMEKVRHALIKLDFRIMKLDAGNLETFTKINRPCPAVDYKTILNNLKSLENVTLQTMFVDGEIASIGEREVGEWMERVGEIKPLKSQIYSLHRPPAVSSLREVPAEKLEEIAARTEEATGVTVEVIVAASPYRRRYNEPYGN
jgi:wyosine [tRNA(Phe)-imidazoG37] synthetase (radical SAM superfamily)